VISHVTVGKPYSVCSSSKISKLIVISSHVGAVVGPSMLIKDPDMHSCVYGSFVDGSGHPHSPVPIIKDGASHS